MGSDQNTCFIRTDVLFRMVNADRNLRGLQPVENSAIASRCALRFNVEKGLNVDFSQKEIEMNIDDLEFLETLLGKHFHCDISGRLRRVCRMPEVKKVQPTADEHPAAETGEKGGFAARLKRLFTK